MFRIRSATLNFLMLVVLEVATCVFAQGNTRERDVVYGRKFGMALTMDVWKPAKQNGIGVIFIVSGAFNSGIEMVDSGFFGPVVFKPFLDRGYTLFLVSHGVPLHENLGEDYLDNPGEVVSEYRDSQSADCAKSSVKSRRPSDTSLAEFFFEKVKLSQGALPTPLLFCGRTG